jgi:hypothetical protein
MGPTLAGNVGTGWAFALNARGGQGVDVPMLAPAPSRSACVPFVGDGAYARREALKDLPLRCAQVFLVFASKARYAPIPLRLRTFCWGWVLRSQGTWGEAWAFALNARGGQGIDVPMLAPPPSRSASAECRWLNGPTPFPPQFQPRFPARFPGKVDGPGRLSAARNFRQGQGGSGGVYPLRYSPPDPTQ